MWRSLLQGYKAKGLEMTIRNWLLAATIALGFFAVPALVCAGELDNRNYGANEMAVRANDLPGTVVVRVDNRTGTTGVLNVAGKLDQKTADIKALAAETYAAMPANGVQELNQSSGTTSWYVCYDYGYFWQPTYTYWGYSYPYVNYYYYSYGYYSYYWYGWA